VAALRAEGAQDAAPSSATAPPQVSAQRLLCVDCIPFPVKEAPARLRSPLSQRLEHCIVRDLLICCGNGGHEVTQRQLCSIGAAGSAVAAVIEDRCAVNQRDTDRVEALCERDSAFPLAAVQDNVRRAEAAAAMSSAAATAPLAPVQLQPSAPPREPTRWGLMVQSVCKYCAEHNLPNSHHWRQCGFRPPGWKASAARKTKVVS